MSELEKLAEFANRDTASLCIVIALIAAATAVICSLIHKL